MKLQGRKNGVIKNVYETDGEITRITLSNSDIKVIVDTEIVESLITLDRNFVYAGTGANKYVKFSLKGKLIALHRFIMGFPEGMVVDHINGNTLDNRKSNLRIITASQNNQNLLIKKTNTSSGYRNVKWSSNANAWRVQITVNKVVMDFGNYKNIDDAIAKAKQARAEYMPYSNESRSDESVVC